MTKVPTILNEQMGTIVLYRDDADKVRVSALLKDETLWMRASADCGVVRRQHAGCYQAHQEHL